MKNRIDRASAAVAECSSAFLPPLIRLVRWPGCSSGPLFLPQSGRHAPRLEVDRIGHHRLRNRLGGRISPHPGEDARVAPPRPSGVKAGLAGRIPWQSPQAVIPQPPDRILADEPLAAPADALGLGCGDPGALALLDPCQVHFRDHRRGDPAVRPGCVNLWLPNAPGRAPALQLVPWLQHVARCARADQVSRRPAYRPGAWGFPAPSGRRGCARRRPLCTRHGSQAPSVVRPARRSIGARTRRAWPWIAMIRA